MSLLLTGAGRAAQSSLLTGLVAYWKLDEASGARSDSVGSNHLTDNNTVTQAAGKVGDAAQFTAANSEYLSIADNAALSMGGDIDFELNGWVYFDAVTGQAVLGKWAIGDSEYLLDLESQKFVFYCRKADNSGNVTIIATTFGNVSVSTWYFVSIVHDAAADLIKISVNDGAFNGSVFAGGVRDGTAPFELGRFNAGSYFGGRLDEWGAWKRILTNAERATRYNSGSGSTYPFA